MDEILRWLSEIEYAQNNPDVIINTCWVESGCSLCGSCAQIASNIFALNDVTSEVRGSARADGIDGRNEFEKSPLTARAHTWRNDLLDAAQSCPQHIIKFNIEGQAHSQLISPASSL